MSGRSPTSPPQPWDDGSRSSFSWWVFGIFQSWPLSLAACTSNRAIPAQQPLLPLMFEEKKHWIHEDVYQDVSLINLGCGSSDRRRLWCCCGCSSLLLQMASGWYYQAHFTDAVLPSKDFLYGVMCKWEQRSIFREISNFPAQDLVTFPGHRL